MNKRQTRWLESSPRPPKPKVPEATNIEGTKAAEKLVEVVLKPQFIEPPIKNAQFNYIVDIYTKWYRSYFYFCSKYACPQLNATSQFFESKFARMEYVGDNRFHLSFMRYTSEWVELYQDLSLNECL